MRFQMGVDLGQPLQKDLWGVQRPEQGVDHDHREAGDQKVEPVCDVERQCRPNRPPEHDKDAEGGHHGAQGRRQGKPIREEQAGEDPQQRHGQIEEGCGAERHEEEGRYDGADPDRQLRQQPVEARAGQAHGHEQVGKDRCQLTTWQVEIVRQSGGQAARQGGFQGMLDLPLAQRRFVEALAWRRGRNHARHSPAGVAERQTPRAQWR